MIDFKASIGNLIQKSAELCRKFADLLAEKTTFEPKQDKIQERRENVWLRLEACRRTGGSLKRTAKLETEYKALCIDYPAVMADVNERISAATDEIRAVNKPIIDQWQQYVRSVIALTREHERVQFLFNAISELRAMELKPLAESVAKMKEFSAVIGAWPRKKDDPFLPTFQLAAA